MAWLEAPISDGAMAFLMPSTSGGRPGAELRGVKSLRGGKITAREGSLVLCVC